VNVLLLPKLYFKKMFRYTTSLQSGLGTYLSVGGFLEHLMKSRTKQEEEE